MSREWTEEEVRTKFLEHVHSLVDYWATVESPYHKTERDRLSGLAFSILSTLDGGVPGLTAFIVAPCPHEDDKAYCVDEGENYYPENRNANVNCDISGGLHEFFHAVGRLHKIDYEE